VQSLQQKCITLRSETVFRNPVKTIFKSATPTKIFNWSKKANKAKYHLDKMKKSKGQNLQISFQKSETGNTAAMFGSTYSCAQLFSKMSFRKSKRRSLPARTIS